MNPKIWGRETNYQHLQDMFDINNCIKRSRRAPQSCYRCGRVTGDPRVAPAPRAPWDSRQWLESERYWVLPVTAPQDIPRGHHHQLAQEPHTMEILDPGTQRCWVDQNWKSRCDFRGSLTESVFVCVSLQIEPGGWPTNFCIKGSLWISASCITLPIWKCQEYLHSSRGRGKC